MQNHTRKWFINTTPASAMAAIAIGAMLVFSAAGTKAFADVVHSNTVNADAQDVTVNVDDTVQIEYWITGSGGDNQGGCNFGPSAVPSGGSATISLNFDSNKLSGPTSVTLNACGPGNSKTVSFTALEAGSVSVKVAGVSDSNSGSGTYTVPSDTTVSVTVAAPSDATAPELTLPSPITEEATGPNGAAVTYTATATDDVDGSVPVSCTPESGSTFPIGTTEVTCSATDAAENKATGKFTVTVVDTTPPKLTLPSNPTEEATGPNGAAVTYTATATDLVDGSLTPTCTPASGSTFALGPTTVTCNAQDKAGNKAEPGSFTVTVVDTTPPKLTLSPISTKATGASGTPVTYTGLSATDLVDGDSVPLSCTPASGSTFKIGTTTVNCSATDAAGNKAIGSFTVTVTVDTKGFYQPIDGNGIYNKGKAGNTIPFKFNIYGATEIKDISVVDSIKYKPVTCSTGAGIDDIEAFSTTQNLKYDSTAGQFVYNSKTPSSAGCYEATLYLKDGAGGTIATIKALLQLTKG
jgi:hypothetical protein